MGFDVRDRNEAKQNNEKKDDRLNRVLNMILPINDWAATSIQNENEMSQKYFEDLREREKDHELQKTLGIPKHFSKGEIDDAHWQRYLNGMLKHK